MTKRKSPPPVEPKTMFDRLPKPPKPFGEQTENDIGDWLIMCGRACGLEGLDFAYRAENFPFGAFMRGRVQHIYGAAWRQLEAEAKAQAEQAVAKVAAKARDDDREIRRAKGWA